MPSHYTHEQITEQVKRYIKKYFENKNPLFIEYVGVNQGTFSRMMRGELPWNKAVLEAIGYEREKMAYVRRKHDN